MDVFLSASIPLPERDRRFFETADVLLIREAIKALVEVVLPTGRLTCGGHPAITPLLSLFVREAGLPRERVTVFQSQFFVSVMPAENVDFVDVRMTPSVSGRRDASLTLMREQMIASRPFTAAVVIGGMEGIFEEVEIFRRLHPRGAVLPLASTGAAASHVYATGEYDAELAQDLTFSSLFRRRLHR